MNLALPLIALGPAAGAVMILAGGGSARARRSLASAGLGAGIGASIFVLIEVVPGRIASARGLETDAWRAGLALAALVVAAAAFPSSERGPVTMIAHLATAAAAAGAMLTTEVISIAGFLVLASTGVLLGARVERSQISSRFAVWLIASDLLAIGGLLLAARDGVHVPIAPTGAAAGLLLAAATIRCGVVPWTRIPADLAEADRATAGAALGPLRAQGLLLAGWVALGGGDPARALALVGAITAALCARRAAREASGGAALCAVTGLVLAGMGMGGVAGVWGATLLAAGTFVGATLHLLGAGALAGGSVAIAPLGATLPGGILIGSASLARGIVDAADLAVAIPVALALGWLIIAGVAGARGSTARVHPIWIVAPSLTALTLAIVPGRALRAIGEATAPFLGAGRPLADLPGAVGDDVGVLFAVAAVGGIVAATSPRAARPIGSDMSDQTAEATVSRPTLLGIAMSVAGVLVLLWVGIRRGFI